MWITFNVRISETTGPGRSFEVPDEMTEIRGFCTGVTGVCPAGAGRPAAQAINHEGVGCWSLEFGSLGLFDINRGPRAFLHIARAHLGRILCLDP